ncbi:DNA mismatch repair protein MutS [Pseudalkalibacillus hwajinpoensis]|uniref:DNA mismatch repair protein MutS n=1 Tax=Guptibacillus hwajinpoensis TaxID=208199 RepID=A0A4U1MM21_9BACL|nr:DNA mismatch repair protein MutS [Pseudalkalibacillus hwajinpoensis]TKD71612.1 DNA mismatch repair protein MutS [Pseudalkalibacillus hwajinpoensis]
MARYTPMMEQYLRIKAEYQDAFLFFRLGDFYEMFFDDATRASKELEITLTSRDGGEQGRIPMCGVPYHAADNYISQLVTKGYKIAICEQTEDPKQAKGVVRREVVQLITPGTVMSDHLIKEKENNYIVAISAFEDNTFALAANDLTTGESMATILAGDHHEVIGELSNLAPREVILNSKSEELSNAIQERMTVTISIEDDTTIPEALTTLSDHIDQPKLLDVFGRLLQYLIRTQKRSMDHLQPLRHYHISQYMKLDVNSKRNLELVETIRDKKRTGSLVWFLDSSVTAMGGRLLKQWVERPLLKQREIEKRQELVETLMKQFFERETIREQLQGVYDLERLAGKVAFGNLNARDLVQLRKSLEKIPEIKQAVNSLDNPYAKELGEEILPCEELVKLLQDAIEDNPPLSVKEGQMIRDGYHEDLDKYRDASRNGKDWIAALQMQERERTGIKSLKIGYNKVFGYYIEVTRSNLPNLPEGRYERKQTLSNAERFITPELKEKETLILEAEEKIVDLEYSLFANVREEVKAFIPQLQQLARKISELDVLQAFAVVSEENRFTKPVFSKERKVAVEGGRHPVVEKMLKGREYVANDVIMDRDREILLITGPNMSGKSTYMRQLALISILGQIGCFVPAESAVLPVFDQIFTRIGAADDLAAGQSTFMVEMLEANYAITRATQDSLILLDEIGRGTSTYDGMALAQSIIEYVHSEVRAKTLFSTHYHELTTLEEELDRVKNVHVKAVEEKGRVVFLHRVHDGSADKSYGIHVAQLANLPESLIKRAEAILKEFESDSYSVSASKNELASTTVEPTKDKASVEEAQLAFFNEDASRKPARTSAEKAILDRLKSVDIMEMTPMDAINTLYELKKHLKS